MRKICAVLFLALAVSGGTAFARDATERSNRADSNAERNHIRQQRLNVNSQDPYLTTPATTPSGPAPKSKNGKSQNQQNP